MGSPVGEVLWQEDGKLIVRGSFRIGSTTVAVVLLRLNADGSVDPTFKVAGQLDGVKDHLLTDSGRFYSASILTFNSRRSAVGLLVNEPAMIPGVTLSPASRQAAVGATVDFVPTVTGTAPFTYQWKLNGALITGATNATLRLTNVGLAQALHAVESAKRTTRQNAAIRPHLDRVDRGIETRAD